MDLIFIENLKKQLTDVPLPGLEGQLKMAPPMRRELLDDRYRQPENPKLAAVLCLLFWENDVWNVVLIERAGGHPSDRHAGQIAFPGGKVEPADVSLAAAALREAEEEIGATAEKVVVLGRLTELFIPVSGFLIHPFVGFLEEKTAWLPQASEVKSILEVPILDLQKKGARQVKDLTVGPGVVYQDIPYFEVENQIVWGATAMILGEFLEVLGRVEK